MYRMTIRCLSQMTFERRLISSEIPDKDSKFFRYLHTKIRRNCRRNLCLFLPFQWVMTYNLKRFDMPLTHHLKLMGFQYFPSLLGCGSFIRVLLMFGIAPWDLQGYREAPDRGLAVAATKSMEWISAYRSRYGKIGTASIVTALITEYVIVAYHEYCNSVLRVQRYINFQKREREGSNFRQTD